MAARRDSQRKQRLLQSGAADDDIPEGVADRFHFHMKQLTPTGRTVGGVEDCKSVENCGMERGVAGSENLNEVDVEGLTKSWSSRQPANNRPALRTDIFCQAGSSKKPSSQLSQEISLLKSALNEPRNCCFAQRHCGRWGTFH